MPKENRSKRFMDTKAYNLTIGFGEKKFIWYRVAKVGTRTIFNHLRNNNVSLEKEHSYGLAINPNNYDGYYKFAFARNPFDRLVSCWLGKKDGRSLERKSPRAKDFDISNSFSAFIDFLETEDLNTCNIHYRLQSRLVDLEAIDFLGRMETFDADLMLIFNYLGIAAEDIKQRNMSKTRMHYHSYYTGKDVERVAVMYKRDLQIFGYKF